MIGRMAFPAQVFTPVMTPAFELAMFRKSLKIRHLPRRERSLAGRVGMFAAHRV
jgi:hypothetical protein